MGKYFQNKYWTLKSKRRKRSRKKRREKGKPGVRAKEVKFLWSKQGCVCTSGKWAKRVL